MPDIRPLSSSDWDSWRRLYLGYAEFYAVETDEDKLSTLFGWLLDPGHVCDGLVAANDDLSLVGLAHFRSMPSPLRGAEIGFLDDLFVDPLSRGLVSLKPFSKRWTRLPAIVGGMLSDGSQGMEIIVPAVSMTASL